MWWVLGVQFIYSLKTVNDMVNVLGFLGALYTLGGMFAFLINGNDNSFFATFCLCTGFILFILYVVASDKQTKQEIEQRNRNLYK